MRHSILLIAFLFCNNSNATESTAINKLGSRVEVTYYVKGMTCGGCIFSVKMALKNIESKSVLTRDIGVGLIKIKYKENKYEKQIMDCSISRAVEKMTDFKVYLDQAHQLPACVTSK